MLRNQFRVWAVKLTQGNPKKTPKNPLRAFYDIPRQWQSLDGSWHWSTGKRPQRYLAGHVAWIPGSLNMPIQWFGLHCQRLLHWQLA